MKYLLFLCFAMQSCAYICPKQQPAPMSAEYYKEKLTGCQANEDAALTMLHQYRQTVMDLQTNCH